tara:strand:- start:311 stop:589 length:279 start_codon:yes stop_codon:yes gene_type:complete
MMAQGKPNEWLERIKLNEVMQKMNYELYELPKRVIFRYEWILVTGFLLMTLAISNELGYTNFSGDFFWALCGAALCGEAIVELYYERKRGGI